MTSEPRPRDSARRRSIFGLPRLSSAWAARRRMLAWWSGTILVGAVCLLQVGLLLAKHADIDDIATPVLCLVAFVVLRLSARLEYRRGWRNGFEEAQRMALQDSHGLTPDVVVRAAIHGDPTPEPWHPHVPLFGRRTPQGDGGS